MFNADKDIALTQLRAVVEYGSTLINKGDSSLFKENIEQVFGKLFEGYGQEELERLQTHLWIWSIKLKDSGKVIIDFEDEYLSVEYVQPDLPNITRRAYIINNLKEYVLFLFIFITSVFSGIGIEKELKNIHFTEASICGFIWIFLSYTIIFKACESKNKR